MEFHKQWNAVKVMKNLKMTKRPPHLLCFPLTLIKGKTFLDSDFFPKPSVIYFKLISRKIIEIAFQILVRI